MASVKGSAQRLQSRYAELAGARWHTGRGERVPEQSAKVPQDPEYWQDQLHLAIDPARGDKVATDGIEEAVVALHASHHGVLRGIEREATGHSEFTDWQGQMWDVKSPISSPPGSAWSLDVGHQLQVVKEEVEGDENVLLNLTLCNPVDVALVQAALKEGLSDWESVRVLVLAKVP